LHYLCCDMELYCEMYIFSNSFSSSHSDDAANFVRLTAATQLHTAHENFLRASSNLCNSAAQSSHTLMINKKYYNIRLSSWGRILRHVLFHGSGYVVSSLVGQLKTILRVVNSQLVSITIDTFASSSLFPLLNIR